MSMHRDLPVPAGPDLHLSQGSKRSGARRALLALSVVVAAMLPVGLVAGSASASPAPTLKVGLLASAPYSSYTADVQSKLAASGAFAQVTTLPESRCGAGTPSLAELQQYDVAYVWSDCSFADANAVGNVLADYIDGGGHVVVSTFATSSNSPGLSIGGRFASGGYLPTTSPGYQQTAGTREYLAPVLTGDPLLAGVTSFDGGSASYHNSNLTVTPGSTLVARWSDGQPLVSYRSNVVELNFYPPSNAARSDFWNSATDGTRLMINALNHGAPTDNTAPVLSSSSNVTAEATSAAGAVVTYPTPTATDVDDTAGPVSCTPASGSTFPLGSTTVTCSSTDTHSNTGTSTFTVLVQDTTAPVVTVPANLTATATSASGAPVTFNTSALDTVSGSLPTTCSTPSGSTFGLGTTTVTCTATDAAGNTGTASFTVTVTYAWSGILQPVNADGSSIFKAGSTVPVKFALTGASAGITNATATISYAKVTNGVDGTYVEATSTAAATTGNLFRYDATSGQYIFNLATKGLTTGTYRISVNLGDGVNRSVIISLK